MELYRKAETYVPENMKLKERQVAYDMHHICSG